MFSGESTHVLDAKQRVVVPRRFEGQFDRNSEGRLSVVLTRGFEKCLFLFSQAHFEVLLARMSTQPFGGQELRKMQRLFFSNTHPGTLDGSGRLVLPEKLRKFAGITKEVTIVGVADRAEIWDRQAWNDFEEANADEFDSLDSVFMGNAGISEVGPPGMGGV